MIVRTVNGQAFNFSYDAENRMVSVSGAMAASFAYDGDGNRVKSTIGGTTTSFVGNYCEVTGSTATKYYYAGGQRIAMRQGTTLHYLLGDHLGSTTVTTDASGNPVSELRYAPWGEVRSGTAPTNYTYTGQYSNTADFGLMYYNARWYDPALSRFTSADTIVPEGVQCWDRFAYVNNSPLNYTDPSGHGGERTLRELKRDYGRYWDDVKGGWHREGDRALTAWSDRIQEEQVLALVRTATGGGKPNFGLLLSGTPPPPEPLRWLESNLQLIWGSGPSWLFTEAGRRVLTVDHPHPAAGVPYWHLNSDIAWKWIQTNVNHRNIEPAVRFFVTSAAALESGARWIGGTLIDPMPPIPAGPLQDMWQYWNPEIIMS